MYNNITNCNYGGDYMSISNINRDELIKLMSENLSVLRAKLSLSQEDLADVLGVTRQTISAIENEQRNMSWSIFLSLILIFLKNKETKRLMILLGIYTKELSDFITF